MRRFVASALTLVGVICLVWFGADIYARSSFQRDQARVLDRALEGEHHAARPARAIERRGLIGRLEIPRLGLSTVVIEGDDGAALKMGVGHLPDTPLPWQPGNSALAGHRDSFFRPLRRIRRGDEIRFLSPEGRFVYRVREVVVTTPYDLDALASNGGADLTLLTCYPFFHFGAAPDRFVVHAERVDAIR